jgi:hypothetical protein
MTKQFKQTIVTYVLSQLFCYSTGALGTTDREEIPLRSLPIWELGTHLRLSSGVADQDSGRNAAIVPSG